MASYASRFAQHWARLKYTREGEPPSRDQVGEKLLFASGGINVKDVYSFIALPNGKDFELCFFHEDALRRFMETAYAKSNEVPWSNWTIDSSIAIDTINVVVKFWTGRVSDHDIELFLMRHGDILQAPYKPVDRFGIWYGVRKYKLQLKKDANGHPITLPNSISLGPYNGRVIYSGQRQTCFVCGAPDHQVKECTQMKCWKCGGLGHKAKDCSNDSRCSLCGGVGHTYFKCPHSYSNKAKNQNRARAEDEQQPRQNQQEPQESAREPQTAAQQEPLPDGNNTQCATTRQQLPESGEERSSTAPLRRGTQPVAVGKDEGRLVVGRGSFISVLRRQEAPGGAQQQAKHTILEGERVTSTIVQQQRPPDVERELKLLCAAEVSLPSTDGGSHSQSSTSSSSSSPNSSGTGEGSGEEDEDDGEVYDSASEEPDSPDIQEFSSEPATIRFCAENIMHTQMQMAKSPRTSTKNVPVTGQQIQLMMVSVLILMTWNALFCKKKLSWLFHS
ncbi:uncharacterized protein LOC118219608 isoform X4 [Anguilla anguilla]|uniref:uncharacterized protein LOC118219608 isoform X4 n=1 Tax=Anguilla anguilla TaxID=7936 RepID=UPI0015B004C5|nr:uncharacterized protein LOC118219608 isoform X4 [Anguilla anguilla]